MDYAKFEKLLQQKALYFCGAKKFEDSFEGEYAWGPKGNKVFVERQRELHKVNGGGIAFEGFMAMNMRTLNEIASYTYVNCWHQSPHESEAMWKLYCKEPKSGVLIKTTQAKLRSCLELSGLRNLNLKPVKYVKNFWIKQYNPENDVFFNKRISFEHEKEFRAFFQEDPYAGRIAKSGCLVSVDLQLLLDEIRVSPLSSSSFLEQVKEVSSDSGLSDRVFSSEIELQPEMTVEEHLLFESEGYKQYAIRLIGAYS